MKRKVSKPDPKKAEAHAQLDALHVRLEKEYPSFTWWRRPNCITLEGATLSYLMYCIPVGGREVVDCRNREGVYTSHKGYGDKTMDLPIPIAGMSVAWFRVEPLGQGYPAAEATAPKLTTMYQGKEVEYEICNPTPAAVALIERAVRERKDQVMEGLLADLWESHVNEIMDDHGGDKGCTYCDTMREACRLLKIEAPNLASHSDSMKGPLYREVDL